MGGRLAARRTWQPASLRIRRRLPTALVAAAGFATLGNGGLFLLPGRVVDARSRQPPAGADGKALERSQAGAGASGPAPAASAGTSGQASAANLGKNIVGAGVLALPASASQVIHEAQSLGIDHSAAVAGLVLLFSVFGALNAVGFYLIGEVCARTGAQTYQSAWKKTMGEDLAWVPSVASLICCLTGTIASASVIGDTASDLLTATSGITLDAAGQSALLWGISSFVLLPLCLLPSLAPLAFASLLGLVGVAMLAAVMAVRFFDASYLPGGEFHQMAAWHSELFPGEGAAEQGQVSVGLAELAGHVLLFMALLSNAYAAHYNAPTIYTELEEPQQAPGSVDHKLASFRDVVCVGFGFSALLFLVVTLLGLETFGTALEPQVLNNYAGGDHLAFVARVGLCLCVLFEFPLLERCFRSTAAELCSLPAGAATHPLAAMGSVALAVCLACTPGLGFDKVSAVGGALGASLLIYVAPALMVLQLREETAGGTGTTEEVPVAFRTGTRPVEVMALRTVVGLGTALGGLGVAEATGLSSF